ncbi:unnamed protein product [Ectocarpus sp. 4 AP-2014]
MALRNSIASRTRGAATALCRSAITAERQVAPMRLLRSTTARGDGVQPADTSAEDVTKNFGDPSFWEREYNGPQGQKAFEWFLSYDGGLKEYLIPVLESLVMMPSSHSRESHRLLHVGCGTSEVGPKLAEEPALSSLHVTDIDSSPTAVRLMKKLHEALGNYDCREGDVLNLDFPAGRFDVVVDKGTVDALLCRSAEDALAMVSEVHRVLRKGGVYVQISAEDPEARLELLTECGSSSGRGPWSRSFFKELGESEGSAAYYMYVLVK